VIILIINLFGNINITNVFYKSGKSLITLKRWTRTTESRTQNKLVREEDKIMSLGTVLSAASAGVTSRPKPGTATPTALT
jgi:hypothetical protein